MSRVFVGNLPLDVRRRDLEDLFYKFGKILEIDIKLPPHRPAYAFIDFDHPRDAEDAVRARDRYIFEGEPLRVEISHGRSVRWNGGDSRRGPSRRSDFRVIITGLPPTGSWQDLKDHMRKAGDVCFSDVTRDGTGVVEYTRFEDMKYALNHLNNTEFRSHKGETSVVRVREENRSPSPRGRSRRSPSPRRRSLSPGMRRRSASPRRRSASPRRHSLSGERGRSKSPIRSSKSPKRSSRSPSPRNRSKSPRRYSPTTRSSPGAGGRSPSPGKRTSTPRDRSPSPA